MLGIEDINLDIKIQRRISKQHSTILGTAGKQSGDIYFSICANGGGAENSENTEKNHSCVSLEESLNFAESRGIGSREALMTV